MYSLKWRERGTRRSRMSHQVQETAQQGHKWYVRPPELINISSDQLHVQGSACHLALQARHPYKRTHLHRALPHRPRHRRRELMISSISMATGAKVAAISQMQQNTTLRDFNALWASLCLLNFLPWIYAYIHVCVCVFIPLIIRKK